MRYDADLARLDWHANNGDRFHQKSSTRSGYDSSYSANLENIRPRSECSGSRVLSGSVRSIRDKYNVPVVRSRDRESPYVDCQKYKDKDPSADRDESGMRHTNSKFRKN